MLKVCSDENPKVPSTYVLNVGGAVCILLHHSVWAYEDNRMVRLRKQFGRPNEFDHCFDQMHEWVRLRKCSDKYYSTIAALKA